MATISAGLGRAEGGERRANGAIPPSLLAIADEVIE
jgi:hypothetical protein